MDLGLKNKVIIVAGNAGGIEEAIHRTLSGEGAIPILLERRSQPGSNTQAVKAIHDRYGRIDGLVNLAGMNNKDVPESAFDQRFMENVQENLSQCFLITNAVLPFLKISKGAIVNINYHSNGNVTMNTPVYAASNGGLNALTREWAVDLLKYEIRVNSVIPIEHHDYGTEASSSTTENTVAFLLSEKSSHTTGQLIHVKVASQSENPNQIRTESI